MKMILLICLLALVPCPAQAQDFFQSFMAGQRMAAEQERIQMEKRLLQQQIEMNNIQMESMRTQRQGQSDAFFQEGYKQGFEKGYKQGTDDFFDHIKQSYQQIQFTAIGSAARGVYQETSTEILIEARKMFSEIAAKDPDDYAPKVYNMMIDERLKQLGYKGAKKKDRR